MNDLLALYLRYTRDTFAPGSSDLSGDPIISRQNSSQRFEYALASPTSRLISRRRRCYNRIHHRPTVSSSN